MQPFITSMDNTKGFTLLEAMIGLFFISIGLMAITRMQIASINGNASAMSTMMATAETNYHSEILLSTNFDTLTPDTPQTEQSPDGKYTTTYTVTDVPIFDNNMIKSIAVVTTWTDSKGNPVSIHSTITKTPN